MNGYHDRLAWVDLEKGEVKTRPLGSGMAERFIGGGNLGAAMLARMTDPKTDALSGANPLAFLTGPLTGTGLPFSSRHQVVSLSPLTGLFGESSCGGSLAWKLRRSGLDGLVFTGRSPHPVVTVVSQSGVVVRHASELWGLDAFQTDERLKEEYGSGSTTATIGPAGEKLVRFASISHDGRATRSAGRCGMGAVMGSKGLKAVLVTADGQNPPPVADPAGLSEIKKRWMRSAREKLEAFGAIGTPGGLVNYDKLGNLPINNWRTGQAPELAGAITGTNIVDRFQVRRSGCRGCPVQCGRLVEVGQGPYATEGQVEGPEYETLAGFGSLCLNNDLESIVLANQRCNQLGLDTISTAGVIGFILEAVEKGFVGATDLGLDDPGFGRPETVLELIEVIASRQGRLGYLLGEGVRRTQRMLGPETEAFALQVKGLEPPMHDPRFSWGQALGFATGPRGACHLNTMAHAYELALTLPELGWDRPQPGRRRRDKARAVIDLQNLMGMMDSLCLCKFSLINDCIGLPEMTTALEAVTGKGVNLGSFMTLGERGFVLKRLINLNRGTSDMDDALPPRFAVKAKTGPELNLEPPPLAGLLEDYYALRRWNLEGRVGGAVIQRLGLQDMVQGGGNVFR